MGALTERERNTVSQYPEHEKMKAVTEMSQSFGEFIDILASKGMSICQWDESREQWREVRGSINQKLAKMFDIDLDLIEDEKRDMLNDIQRANKVDDLKKMAEDLKP